VQNQLVAVTASNVFLFDFLANGAPFAITAPPTVWPRAGLRVTADVRGRMSQRLHVELAGGERLELDVNFSKGPWATFNDAMLGLLVAPPQPTALRTS